jgi:hypothetical protein
LVAATEAKLLGDVKQARRLQTLRTVTNSICNIFVLAPRFSGQMFRRPMFRAGCLPIHFRRDQKARL